MLVLGSFYYCMMRQSLKLISISWWSEKVTWDEILEEGPSVVVNETDRPQSAADRSGSSRDCHIHGFFLGLLVVGLQVGYGGGCLLFGLVLVNNC